MIRAPIATTVGRGVSEREARIALTVAAAIVATDFAIVIARLGWAERSSLVVASSLILLSAAVRLGPAAVPTLGLRIVPAQTLRFWAIRIGLLVALLLPVLIGATLLADRWGQAAIPTVDVAGLGPLLVPGLLVAPLHEGSALPPDPCASLRCGCRAPRGRDPVWGCLRLDSRRLREPRSVQCCRRIRTCLGVYPLRVHLVHDRCPRSE